MSMSSRDRHNIAMDAIDTTLCNSFKALCEYASVPPSNRAMSQHRFHYRPARIGLWSLTSHGGESMENWPAQHDRFLTREVFTEYLTSYTENFLGMLLSEFEGENHVLDRMYHRGRKVGGDRAAAYARDFADAVDAIMAPASIEDPVRKAAALDALNDAFEAAIERVVSSVVDGYVALGFVQP